MATNRSQTTTRPRRRMEVWKAPFIEALKDCGNVKDACVAAGIDRRAAYRARDADKIFAQAWDDACEEAYDSLEKEAFRRARNGVLQPVFYQGEKVADVMEYSDPLLQFLIRGNRKKYAERFEHSGPGGEPLAPAQVVLYQVRLPENGREKK